MERMKAYVSLDDQSYNKKPVKTEIPKIKYRAVSKWELIEVDELADLVGNHGHAMVPAHLEGGIASRNFKGIQLFTLDFDHGCKFDEIKKRCGILEFPSRLHIIRSALRRKKKDSGSYLHMNV